METITSTAVVPKIHSHIASDQFEVEIIPTASLGTISWKCIKIKLSDEAGKELVGHYFMPADVKNEEKRKAIMGIPPAFLKSFK